VAEQVHPYNQTLHQMLHLYHWIPVRLLHFIMDIVDVFDGCYRCFSSLLECRHYIPRGSHIFYLFSDQLLFVRSKPLTILMTLEMSSHLVIVFVVHNGQTPTSITQQITLDFEHITTLQSSVLPPFLLGLLPILITSLTSKRNIAYHSPPLSDFVIIATNPNF
jgi:hypothetical protein